MFSVSLDLLMNHDLPPIPTNPIRANQHTIQNQIILHFENRYLRKQSSLRVLPAVRILEGLTPIIGIQEDLGISLFSPPTRTRTQSRYRFCWHRRPTLFRSLRLNIVRVSARLGVMSGFHIFLQDSYDIVRTRW